MTDSDITGAPAGALDGIRVVDLTRILAGPFCTLLLADMGADVIKVEPPAGDPVRGQGAMVEGYSWYFAQFNRNKKSVVLDLYTDEGKADLTRLLETADVVVENYRPGVFAKMGFSAERLAEINPRLICASVNGYGSSGPYVDRPAFDFIAQAMSGFMAVNGDPDGPPSRAAPPISDLIAGLYCAFGVVSALQARHTTGRGQQVESSLTGGLISMMAYLSAEYFATGANPTRTGNNHPIVAPYGLFQAADGEIAVAPSNDTFVERFLRVLGLEGLLREPDFADNAKRMANRDALNARINAVTREKPVDHWIDAINKAGCPAGRVMGLDEVFTDPQVLAQEMVIQSEREGRTPIRMTGFPVKLSQTPAALRQPPPELGEHTEQIITFVRNATKSH
ncbi:CaiB/BaiF CoA transferase family protein [Thalassobaculum litoreum]|uniref:CoA-transferase family III n=1 Tax=Thalassobaculum litoreum DSM 18839 TaxID=1123362 RepID=A0A8G2BGF0_9PROT|nr:CoA transferase [Thalassobaculum litoreum]SDF41715.1 CoA-transferase family III [Thalassobaculum litoreum DSM 18839]